MVTWELRFRTPRTLDNVQIQTLTESEDEAKALSEAYIRSLASPSNRFVAVRRIIVAKSTDFPEVLAIYGPTAAAGKKGDRPATGDPEDKSEVGPVQRAAARIGQ